MRIKIRMLLAILLFGHAASAQQREIDSLETLLKSYTKKDTVRASLRAKLAMYYSYVDPDKSLAILEENIAMAQSLKSDIHLAKSYNCKGLNFEHLGKDSLAIYWYGKGSEVAQRTNNLPLKLGSLNLIANLYNNRSEYQKSLAIRNKMLKMVQGRNEPDKLGTIYSNMGVSYYSLSDYPKATEYYIKALREFAKGGTAVKIANCYQNIGLVYKKMGDFSRSLTYYKKAEKVFEDTDDQAMLANLLGNMGAVYDDLNQPEKALACYKRGLDIALKIKDKRNEAMQLANIGTLYQSLNKHREAYQNLMAAKAIYDQTRNDNAMSVVLSALGELLLKYPDAELQQIGTDKNQRLLMAENYATEALTLARSIGSLDREMISLDCLSQIYERQGQYAKALTAYKEFRKLNDSIASSDNQTAIARKEMQFESDKKQAQANAEIERQKVIRYGTIGGSTVLLFSGVLLFRGYRRRQTFEHRAAVANLRTRVLRLQMNPHFIFNSLNSISDYIGKNDIKSADYYLAKFSKLMRGTLENSDETEIPLAEELKMLELYMQLESARLNQKFSYEFKIDDNIDPETTLVPPLILQPFVENSIWHGMTDKESNGKITIEATRNDNMLQCVVEDNGSGRKNAKKEGKSYGMKITRDRIELLNRMQNTNASVHLVDLEKGMRVEVLLPFNQSDL